MISRSTDSEKKYNMLMILCVKMVAPLQPVRKSEMSKL